MSQIISNEIAKNKTQEEHLEQTQHYAPRADIFETSSDIYVVLDMPGTQKDKIDVHLEKDLLEITGKVDTKEFSNLEPIISEYNVGNFKRKFNISDKISKEDIDAKFEDGVLSIRLPKIPEAQPRTIQIK